jgi:GT2 family glycosyltransferase
MRLRDFGSNVAETCNRAAEAACGEYLLFVDSNIQTLSPGWAEGLVVQLHQQGVGAVGPRIQYPDGRLKSAGGVLGIGGAAGDAMDGEKLTDGQIPMLERTREVSVLSAACLMLTKSSFNEIGGYDDNFPAAFAGEDLCLRLRERGMSVLHVPEVTALCAEGTHRENVDEQIDKALFCDRWDGVIDTGDPYYNPNLDLESGRFGLAFPPR